MLSFLLDLVKTFYCNHFWLALWNVLNFLTAQSYPLYLNHHHRWYSSTKRGSTASCRCVWCKLRGLGEVRSHIVNRNGLGSGACSCHQIHSLPAPILPPSSPVLPPPCQPLAPTTRCFWKAIYKAIGKKAHPTTRTPVPAAQEGDRIGPLTDESSCHMNRSDVYSEDSHTEFNSTYAQVSVHLIEALVCNPKHI